jgi:hypothetical protein
LGGYIVQNFLLPLDDPGHARWSGWHRSVPVWGSCASNRLKLGTHVMEARYSLGRANTSRTGPHG